jgi:hypothetical protein
MTPNTSSNAMSPAEADKHKVAHITQTFSTLLTRFAPLRQQMLRNYRYAIGEQIDPEVREQLAREKRPALVFRLMDPLLLFLSGTLQKDRQKLRAVPVRRGDEDLSDLHTVLVSDYAMEGCDGYEAFSKAALDAAIAKIGVLNNFYDTRNDPEGEWRTEADDPLSYVWDPDGRKLDQSDWRYIAKHGMYSADEIIGIYGDSLSDDMKFRIRQEAERIEGSYEGAGGKPVGWWNRVLYGIKDALGFDSQKHPGTSFVSEIVDARSGLFRVIEWHDRRTIRKQYVYSPYTGSMEQIPDDKLGDEQYVEQAKLRHVGATIVVDQQETFWTTVVVPALIDDMPILEKPYTVQQRGFQFKFIFCYNWHPDLLQSTCLVDALISPSDLYNQRMMTMLEAAMDAINPRYNVPEYSIDPKDLAAWESKERGVMRIFKPVMGTLKPEPERPDSASFHMHKVLADESRDVHDRVAGFSPNLQGFSETSNEPASLFAARVEQGMTMLAHFFGNIYKTMRLTFNYCDAALVTYMTFPRMVRLLAEPPPGVRGVEYDPSGGSWWLSVNMPTMQGIMNDLKQSDYDFRVDLTQTGQTAKRLKFIETMELAKHMPPELVYWPKLFELHDSPVSKDMQQYAEHMMGMRLGQQQFQQGVQQVGAIQQLAERAMSPTPQPQPQKGSAG